MTQTTGLASTASRGAEILMKWLDNVISVRVQERMPKDCGPYMVDRWKCRGNGFVPLLMQYLHHTF